jgi:endosialidase-like protein
MKLFRLFAAFTLISIAISPSAQAVVPPPDGAYPNFTTAEGQNALQGLTSGVGNTALGAYSLFGTTTGSFNTAVGAGALDLNTGENNTAVGAASLLFNTGANNTAVGVDALALNTTGESNAAVGAFALYNNSAGQSNTAIGSQSLLGNTTGNNNTANGAFALLTNTSGSANSAFGFSALQSTTGVENTGTGSTALFSNTTGDHNTANGSAALYNNTTGDDNTAIGFNALISNTTGINNTAVGRFALGNNIAGNDNIALGNNAGGAVTGSSGVICIGSVGANVTNSCFIDHIRGTTTAHADAIPVLIDSTGQLGTVSSSQRFKHDIKSMEKASENILALKPVTFHYKSDKTNTPQFGLIAEDVAKVNPDLVVRDENGEIYTVRYDAVNAMLLNEFLKEHHKVQELEASNVNLKHHFAEQQKQIEILISGLQKVSAQLELEKAAPQTVVNNR